MCASTIDLQGSTNRRPGGPPVVPLRNTQNYFAELLAVFEAFVRFGGALERHHAINYRLEQAALEKLERSEKLGLESHERAEHRELPNEEVVDINFCIEAGGGSAGHQASAGLEAVNALIPGDLADVFEDDVHAAARGKALHFTGELAAVEPGFVRPERFRFRELGLGPGRGDHARPRRFRDLNRGAAHAAACGNH